jgi:transposase InsO family protein
VIKSLPSVKYQIIREMVEHDNNLLNIEWLCEIAGVSRSGYYRWLKAEPTRNERDECDKADYELILKAYKHRGYDKGARGINMRLLREETPVVINVKKIRRLMKKFGLHCPIRQANPYRRMMKAMKTNRVAKNIVDRNFSSYGPRMVLLTDITYIPCGDGKFIYLSVITDACTRQVLSYVYSDSLEIDFVLVTVKKLIKKHGDTLNFVGKTLFHSDQGSHYTCNKLIDLINDYGLRQSMSRRANCWDNAPQESFFGHMKDEINIKGLSYDEICSKIDDWMDYYNNERYVWNLHKLSPNEYYEWLKTGVYPLGGSAPEPPEFSAFVFQSDNYVFENDKSGDETPPLVTSKTLQSAQVALQRCPILNADKSQLIIPINNI